MATAAVLGGFIAASGMDSDGARSSLTPQAGPKPGNLGAPRNGAFFR